MIKRTRKQLNDIELAAYIFYSGYTPNSEWTLETWFKAKDIVSKNMSAVNSIIPKTKYSREE